MGSRVCIVTLFTFFFDAWYSSSLMPVFFPVLVGTPAATMHSFLVSAVVWVGPQQIVR